jgi:hypothetical protein
MCRIRRALRRLHQHRGRIQNSYPVELIKNGTKGIARVGYGIGVVRKFLVGKGAIRINEGAVTPPFSDPLVSPFADVGPVPASAGALLLHVVQAPDPHDGLRSSARPCPARRFRLSVRVAVLDAQHVGSVPGGETRRTMRVCEWHRRVKAGGWRHQCSQIDNRHSGLDRVGPTVCACSCDSVLIVRSSY